MKHLFNHVLAIVLSFLSFETMCLGNSDILKPGVTYVARQYVSNGRSYGLSGAEYHSFEITIYNDRTANGLYKVGLKDYDDSNATTAGLTGRWTKSSMYGKEVIKIDFRIRDNKSTLQQSYTIYVDEYRNAYINDMNASPLRLYTKEELNAPKEETADRTGKEAGRSAPFVIETKGATDIGSYEATFNAYIDITGIKFNSVSYGFFWGSSDDSLNNNVECKSTITTSNPKCTYSAQLTTLDPKTKYWYKAYIKFGNNIYYGNTKSFTTATFKMTAVDMGLGVKWASCNLGATSPTSYGDYFAWGETEPKSGSWDCTWKYYKWCNGAKDKLTKYCSVFDYWAGAGLPDNKEVLDLADDAAHVILGGKWRMPTKEEWQELMKKCEWTWTKSNGVLGFLITSKINGNSIFLPAAYCRSSLDYLIEPHYDVCCYRSSSGGHSFSRDKNNNIQFGVGHSREEGLPIRPVSTDASITSLSLNCHEAELIYGRTLTLSPKVFPIYYASENSLTWVSSNENVATVKDGIVKGLATGEATITVKCGRFSDKCSVRVEEVSEITLENIPSPLFVGEPRSLEVQFQPKDASPKNVVWESSDPSVATVNDGELVGIAPGKTTITVRCGNKTSMSEVSFRKKVPTESINISPTFSLELGNSKRLPYTIKPLNTTDDLRFYSSNEKIVKVYNGYVGAMKPGVAIVTIVSGDQQAECEVTVTPPEGAVDLGFLVTIDGVEYKVLWAPHNYGASTPEDYGKYLKWDELRNVNKGFWRAPSEDVLKALLENCKRKRVKINGVTGMLFKSKINKESIFLPMGGVILAKDQQYTFVGEEEIGVYWSSDKQVAKNGQDKPRIEDSYRYLKIYKEGSVAEVSGDKNSKHKLMVRPVILVPVDE